MTAIGTVAVAIVAVGVALYTERRADKRVADERKHSADQLQEERDRHDKEIAEERANANAQIEKERQLLREQEQLAQAYAVEIVLVKYPADREGMYRLSAAIINHGNQTITGIQAWFTPDRATRLPHQRQGRKSGLSDLLMDFYALPAEEGPFSAEGASYSDRLTPWDRNLRIDSHPIPEDRLIDPDVIVRWTDRWGTRWEYQRGDVRTIPADQPW